MYWWRRNNKSKDYSRGWRRDESEIESEIGVEVSHGQGVEGSEVEGSEVKGSEVNVLSHSLPSKRMQACLQRFICSEGGAETAILKLFKQCIITVKRLLRIICKHLNYLLNLVCNWVTCNGNFRFPRRGVHVSKGGCTCKQKGCTGRCSLKKESILSFREIYILTSDLLILSSCKHGSHDSSGAECRQIILAVGCQCVRDIYLFGFSGWWVRVCFDCRRCCWVLGVEKNGGLRGIRGGLLMGMGNGLVCFLVWVVAVAQDGVVNVRI